MGAAKFGADMAQTASEQGVGDLSYLTLPLDAIKEQFMREYAGKFAGKMNH
jgi:hypothetical protein